MLVFTSSSDEKIEHAREPGADGGVLYTQDDWSGAVRELAPDGVDLVVDAVGTTWPESLRSLRKGGRLVVFGDRRPDGRARVRFLYLNYLSVLGTAGASPREFGSISRDGPAGLVEPGRGQRAPPRRSRGGLRAARFRPLWESRALDKLRQMRSTSSSSGLRSARASHSSRLQTVAGPAVRRVAEGENGGE